MPVLVHHCDEIVSLLVYVSSNPRRIHLLLDDDRAFETAVTRSPSRPSDRPGWAMISIDRANCQNKVPWPRHEVEIEAVEIFDAKIRRFMYTQGSFHREWQKGNG